MSVDQLTEEIRTQLVAGAQRRMPRERQRVWVGVVAAGIAVIVGVSVLVFRPDNPTRIDTVSTPGSQQPFAVCDEVLAFDSPRTPQTPIGRSEWEGVARDAAATDDATLAELAAKVRDAYAPEKGSPGFTEARIALAQRCRDIGAPNYNPRYVPFVPSPAPTVDLDTYGEPQPFAFTNKPPKVTTRPPAGFDLKEVALGVTPQGGYVMYWTYDGPMGPTTSCLDYGAPAVGGMQDCGSEDIRQGESPLPFRTIDRATILHVPAGTSFVVMESAGERYVQRPASQTAIIVWKTPRNQTPVTAREYDANGIELRCHGAC